MPSPKPSIFVGSSVEGLDVAYAIQDNLDHDAEVTVWNQGVFEPSSYNLEGVIRSINSADFGIFVFTPDDVVKMRDEEQRSVRDNVLFELGAFIGRLGRERCFIVAPRGVKNFRLPSDLLGLTPLQFDPNRQDGNIQAALGPATNQIRRVVNRLGNAPVEEPEAPTAEEELGEADIISIIESWMGSRDADLNTQVIRFADVDRELNLPAGSASKYIEKAAQRWDYVVQRRGDSTILFKDKPSQGFATIRSFR